MKRFTETLKWDDPWFRSLAGAHKLIFLYVIDRCNNAGFWEVDEDALAFHTKLEPKHIHGAWAALERGLSSASGWVWVRNFLRHQKNDVLNPENPAHRQIIALIKDQSARFSECSGFQSLHESTKGHGSPLQGASKGLLSPIGKGKGKGEEGMQGEKQKPSSAKEADAEFIESLKANPAYDGINIDRELGKMAAWLSTPNGKRRKMNRAFIVNWLNKIDQAVTEFPLAPAPKPPESRSRLITLADL